MLSPTAHRSLQAPLQDALLLAARIFPGAVFWQSGRTKVNGWQLNDTALYLFHEEYRLPLVDPVIAAALATIGEHLLPVMLLLVEPLVL